MNNSAHINSRPKSLSECVGQDEVRENISVYIKSAKLRDTPLENLLLCGPAGTGKTTIANAIAYDMGREIVHISSPTVKKKTELIKYLCNVKYGGILFFDEIHAIKPDFQEILYFVMEDSILAVGDMKIQLPLFSLVGATTHQGRLTKPMRDRFGIICELKPYTTQEMVNIILRSFREMELGISYEAAMEMARRSQNTPRIALRLARRIRDFSLATEGDKYVNKKIVIDSCDKLGIDSFGLDATARSMLRLLCEKQKPMGLANIAAHIGEAIETIENCVEPLLLSHGFIERYPQGRVATEKAVQHMLNVK